MQNDFWQLYLEKKSFSESILSEEMQDIVIQLSLIEKGAIIEQNNMGIIRLYSDVYNFPYGRSRARFKRNIRRVLLDAADKTRRKPDIPEFKFKLKVTHLTEGSIEIWVAITVVGGGIYAFFKDYTDLRAGLIQFSRDIVMFSGKIRRIFKKYSGKPKK